MAFEPIDIFSNRIDPRGVAELLRSTVAGVEVVGPDDDWEQIVVVFPKKVCFAKRAYSPSVMMPITTMVPTGRGRSLGCRAISRILQIAQSNRTY